MNSNELQKQHINSFSKLSLQERLEWAFEHKRFLMSFMSAKQKENYMKMRRKGKKYVGQ